jgi:hypothetical protein
MMVAIFTVVPKPTNIAATIEEIIRRPCYKLPEWRKPRDFKLLSPIFARIKLFLLLLGEPDTVGISPSPAY